MIPLIDGKHDKRSALSNVTAKLRITATFVVINTEKNENLNGTAALRKTI